MTFRLALLLGMDAERRLLAENGHPNPTFEALRDHITALLATGRAGEAKESSCSLVRR